MYFTTDKFIYPYAVRVANDAFSNDTRFLPETRYLFEKSKIEPISVVWPYVSWFFEFLFAIAIFQAAFSLLGIGGIYRAKLKKIKNTSIE